MKKITLSTLIIFLFLLIVFSCSKEEQISNNTNSCSNVIPSNKLVKKLKYEADCEIHFFYTQDKIDSIIFYGVPYMITSTKRVRKCTFRYNSDCLINYISDIDYSNIPEGLEWADYEIVYDNNQKPIKCRQDGQEATFNFILNARYTDGFGIWSGGFDTINFYKDDYEIAGNNILKYYYSNRSFYYSYKYDNKLNPIKFIRNLDKIAPLIFNRQQFKVGESSTLNLSKNNVISYILYEGNLTPATNNFSIVYNSDSLPLRIFKNGRNEPTVEYTY